MRIQIDIPEIECVRCSKQGVRQPTMLQMIPENGSAATTTIRDSCGNYWKAAMAKLPAGWETIGIDQKVICADCVKAWHRQKGNFSRMNRRRYLREYFLGLNKKLWAVRRVDGR